MYQWRTTEKRLILGDPVVEPPELKDRSAMSLSGAIMHPRQLSLPPLQRRSLRRPRQDSCGYSNHWGFGFHFRFRAENQISPGTEVS